MRLWATNYIHIDATDSCMLCSIFMTDTNVNWFDFREFALMWLIQCSTAATEKRCLIVHFSRNANASKLNLLMKWQQIIYNFSMCLTFTSSILSLIYPFIGSFICSIVNFCSLIYVVKCLQHQLKCININSFNLLPNNLLDHDIYFVIWNLCVSQFKPR